MEVLNTIIVHLDLNAFHNYIYLTASAQHHDIVAIYITYCIVTYYIYRGFSV